MRPFRFRPQAALDLRIRQEEEALRALALAQHAFDAAALRTTAAIDNAVAAADAFTLAQTEGTSGILIGWHRSWIVKQRLEADARRREAAASAARLDGATAAARAAHQRRRTLERLRARAGRQYEHDVQHEETKAMTQLAGLRYLTLAADDGGTDSDDRSHDSREREHRRDDDHQHQAGPARPRRVHEPAGHTTPAPGPDVPSA
jgi:hypothetical protein